jgi:hypothetical protein
LKPHGLLAQDVGQADQVAGDAGQFRGPVLRGKVRDGLAKRRKHPSMTRSPRSPRGTSRFVVKIHGHAVLGDVQVWHRNPRATRARSRRSISS